jgi:hypothetical protein
LAATPNDGIWDRRLRDGASMRLCGYGAKSTERTHRCAFSRYRILHGTIIDGLSAIRGSNPTCFQCCKQIYATCFPELTKLRHVILLSLNSAMCAAAADSIYLAYVVSVYDE